MFLDLRLGTETGLDVIPQLLAENPNVAIIMITAYATVETAVEAIRRGAWDYLPKPFTPAQIRHLLEKVEAQRSLTAAHGGSGEHACRPRRPRSTWRSTAPAMRSVLEIVARAAQADVPVLFRGESGTGQGGARARHARSRASVATGRS